MLFNFFNPVWGPFIFVRRRPKSCERILFFSLALFMALAFPVWSQSYEEHELTSRNLLLPELDQFRLGSRLFWEKNKKIAAWKAFQTFLFNYPGSPLASDAQFMIAESIFAQAVNELQTGNLPDELSWRKQKKGGLKIIGKGLKRSFEGIKKFGSNISGEEASNKEPDQIDLATFSEAIEQYQVVIDKYKKSGLVDTALFRIAESYYNMGDYPSALEFFRQLQKKYPQSYLIGEAILGAAQCYIPGGDFGSAELEIQKLLSTYPFYRDLPQVQFISGIILFQEGKYEAALKNLEKIETPEAIYYAGQALLKMGKAFAATAKFKKVIEGFKESHFAEQSAYFLADSFFLSKNYPGAIQEYKKFLTLYPQSTLREGALYKIAASYFLNKDYPASRERFNLLLNTFPNGEFASLARYLTAESYRFAQQFKEASFAYGQLISQLPNAPITANARFKLAWVTYLQQNYTNAADAFQKYIDWHPFHAWVPHAYLLMGNCFIKLGRLEDGANSYQQAFDRAPKTELAEAAMALLNRTRYSQKSYGQITSAYTYILKSLPPSESKWRAISQIYLADSYYRQKLYNEAIAVFKSVVSLYPNQPAAFQAWDGLFWCHFQSGDYDQAQKAREKIPQIQLPAGVAAPTMTSGSFELANAFFNQKKYTEALESYEKFLKDSPKAKEVPEAIYRIGLCYYRQEYYTQAIETWVSLESQFPDHPQTEEAVFQVADTYFRAQKYDQAVETYRKILSKYPNNPKIPEATLRIGQSYYNAGEDERAVTELDSFLRKFPKDQRSLETLDLLEAAFDRRESQPGGEAQKQKGIEVLRGLVNDFAQSDLAAECQFRIARRFFNWKDYANAGTEFEKVALSYPDSPHIAESQFYAGESYYSLKNFPEAILTFQRFLKNFSSSDFAAAAWFHLGTAQFNAQSYAEAIESYQNLLRQFPSSEFASAGLYNLALSQKKLQKLTEAADSYKKLALNYPQDPNANFALLEVAKIHQELKQYGEAILVLRDLDAKVAAGDELKQEIAYRIGENYLANNDPEEAIRSFNAVGSLPPKNSDWKLVAIQKLGEIYQSQEKFSEAISVYEEASKIATDPQAVKGFKQMITYLKQKYPGSSPGTPAPAKPPAPKTKQQKTTGGGQ